MSLIAICLTVIVVGVLLWLANTYIPMAPGIKKVLNALVVIVVVVWLLKQVGLWDYVANIKISEPSGQFNSTNKR